MWTFYLLALLPIAVGAVLWVRNKQVIWWEWAISSVVALILAVTFNYAAVSGMTDDKETWSGRITRVEHHPEWVEHWIQHHSESYECGTSERPQTCWRHWTTDEYDTHPEHWEAVVDFGSYSTKWNIGYDSYLNIRKEFGGRVFNGGLQGFNHGGDHHKGDQNIYATANETGFVRPVTTLKKFENKIKAAPSVFSFVTVPTNVPVFNWPDNGNPWVSDRVLGTARKSINLYEWDKLNAELGPLKRVNLIIVGFDSHDSSLGQFQQAKWIGGKKNDLVITYGGDPAKPSWVFTFGWTESELAKRNIDSFIKEHGVNDKLYAFLKDEIIKNYKIKDWKQFDYIQIEPAVKYYYWFIGVMVVVQLGLWFWFHHNDIDKGWTRYRSYYRRW